MCSYGFTLVRDVCIKNITPEELCVAKGEEYLFKDGVCEHQCLAGYSLLNDVCVKDKTP